MYLDLWYTLKHKLTHLGIFLSHRHCFNYIARQWFFPRECISLFARCFSAYTWHAFLHRATLNTGHTANRVLTSASQLSGSLLISKIAVLVLTAGQSKAAVICSASVKAMQAIKFHHCIGNEPRRCSKGFVEKQTSTNRFHCFVAWHL